MLNLLGTLSRYFTMHIVNDIWNGKQVLFIFEFTLCFIIMKHCKKATTDIIAMQG